MSSLCRGVGILTKFFSESRFVSLWHSGLCRHNEVSFSCPSASILEGAAEGLRDGALPCACLHIHTDKRKQCALQAP